MEVAISYTLRLVYDDLRSRLSQLSQNVTTYDHLMYTEHEVKSDTPFEEVNQHYETLMNIQDRVREEIRMINTQLKTLYDERNSNEYDQRKRLWIVNSCRNLKGEFEESLNRLRVMQQNFIQSHKSKVFDLERHLEDGRESGEVGQKMALYRNVANRCETDIHVNGEIVSQLHGLIADYDQSYDTVDISQPGTLGPTPVPESTQPPPLQFNHFDTSHQAITRQQHLIVVMLVAILITMIATICLI